MEEMSLREVAEATGGELIAGSPEGRVSGVSTDSRGVNGGELFVALRGPNHDGHDFVGAALESGANAAMVEREVPATGGKGMVLVNDTLRALGDMAMVYRRSFSSLKAVAVTGSNGKTTTKDIAAHMLRAVGDTVCAQKSFNNDVGVPLTVFEIERDTSYAVFELGTSAPGEIERLADICRPNVGVITNVSKTHLEGLGSEEGVAEAKGELLGSLPADGTAVLNSDDLWCRRLAASFPGKVVFFGLGEDAEVRGEELESDGEGISFSLSGFGRVRLPISGRWNAYNALAAFGVCKALGVEPGQVAGELESFRAAPMRMETGVVDGVRVINDAYNANPGSVAAAVKELAWLPRKGKAVFVMGDMLELGGESARLHRDVGTLVGKVGIEVMLCVGDGAQAACVAAEQGGVDATHFGDWNQALMRLIEIAKPGDVVLVKGSRGMRLERLVEGFNKSRSSQ